MTHLQMSQRGGKANTKKQNEARARNAELATAARKEKRAEKKLKK